MATMTRTEIAALTALQEQVRAALDAMSAAASSLRDLEVDPATPQPVTIDADHAAELRAMMSRLTTATNALREARDDVARTIGASLADQSAEALSRAAAL